jgi:peptidyl-prolyl cis-trans isomerase A (cyclophilin A)
MQCLSALLFASCLLTGAEDKTAPKSERLEKARADLKSQQVAVRRTAIKSLVHSDLSADLREEMHAALKDSDAEVRATAATAVGNLGAAAVPALPMLIAQMQSDASQEARETAARALGRIGKAVPKDRRAVEPLRQTADRDRDPVTRVVALGALAMMEVDIPDQVTALRKYLHDENALVRMKAAHALGMIGVAAKVSAPEIVTVLERATDPHHRGYIARALGNTGDPASLPVLYKALAKETDGSAQGEMRGSIARLGGKVPDETARPVVIVIRTDLGDIEVELDAAKAPATVANFLRYVDGKFYDGGRFHRTVKPDNQPDNKLKIDVIQAGVNPERARDEFAPIKLERTRDTGLLHNNGTISMARDGPDTATADFFICIGDQPELDFGGKRNPDGQGFAAFGRVVKGIDVVKKIQAAPADGQNLMPPVKIVKLIRKP